MLSEKYVQIAKNELREDESRKTQSLQQFRELIDKHPYIRNCRTGNISIIFIYLLVYLRMFLQTTFSYCVI